MHTQHGTYAITYVATYMSSLILMHTTTQMQSENTNAHYIHS